MPHGAMSLGQIAARLSHLEVRCSRCDRRGWLRLDRLIAEHGADFPTRELRHLLAGDCPHRDASIYEHCRFGCRAPSRFWLAARCARGLAA